MNLVNLAIWYLIITTVPGSQFTYTRERGPFTLEECRKAYAAVTVMQWREVASLECRRAVRFVTCKNPDMPKMSKTCCCPILGEAMKP